ncbi:response regulator transcription factor [soil metagenome]
MLATAVPASLRYETVSDVAPAPTVVVIDDEDLVREVVSDYLTRDGFRVVGAADGVRALAVIEQQQPALAIVDIMLPGRDGLSLVRELREAGSTLPIILLTARGDEIDRVMGLELGADDYVTKPFSPRELVARVRSVLRRTGVGPVDDDAPTTLGSGDLVIDTESREVRVRGELIELTPKEYDLLACLTAAPRRVFSHEALLRQVWDSSIQWQDPATVTVHVGRLRRKLGARDNGSWITTVWGVGYRFDP